MKLTDKAGSDLEGIHEKYAELMGKDRAGDMVLRVIDAMERLAAFPNSGRAGIAPDTRELVLTTIPYVIIYGADASVIRVYRILSQRSDRSDPYVF